MKWVIKTRDSSVSDEWFCLYLFNDKKEAEVFMYKRMELNKNLGYKLDVYNERCRCGGCKRKGEGMFPS